MNIKIKNKTLDGKKWQWLYFAILDINDWFGCPFTFCIGNGNTFKNFKVDPLNYKIGSGKYLFSKIIWEFIENNVVDKK